jgi:hypothetical protein
MRDRPEGLSLIQIAAATFREQILPVLPEDKKYVALMVLRALSIAERQLKSDELPLERERDVLEMLLKEARHQGDVHADVLRLERELARQVRSGKHDTNRAAQRLLWDLTVQRVRESAPRYLESEGIE